MTFIDLHEIEKALQPFWPRNLQRYAYTTEYMLAFMDFLGNPQNAIPAVHIAGTSGKTSTAYYTAALLKAAGKKTGLMVSPHIEALNERVQINLIPLPEDQFCKEFTVFFKLMEESGMVLTYAEILYAFAYWEFVRQGVECIVIETGMGGLLDATNVIDRQDKTCIITDIGWDHTNVLGDNLADIAEHKAGIISLHNTVFCYRQDTVIMKVIERVSRQKQADLHIVDNQTIIQDLKAADILPLFQQHNLALAVHCLTELLQRQGLRLERRHIEKAATIYIPARMEIMHYKGKTIIIDGAHNTQKMKALISSVQKKYPDQKVAVLFAASEGRGRDPTRLIEELASISTNLIATEGPNDSITWVEASALAEAASNVGIPKVETVENIAIATEALLAKDNPVLLVTGSLYLAQYVRPVII